MDIEAIRAASYTRAQVANLTGLDDSTLNYWMREGVLRASSGGGGKGQHRRFSYHQVNLALLLDQLRGFGVGLPALKSLSSKFHDAMNFMDFAGLSRRNWDFAINCFYFDTPQRIPDELSKEERAIFERVDRLEWKKHHRYWAPVTFIGEQASGDNYISTPETLIRLADGEWEIGNSDRLPDGVHSFVGIDLDQLTFHAWSRA